ASSSRLHPCADVMIRLPALLLAGCVVSAGLILLAGGSDSPLFERSPAATGIKTGAQAREIVEPQHGATQHLPQTASSDNGCDLHRRRVGTRSRGAVQL